MEDSMSLLSVLSYVAHGYVGNRATAFPLQYYGWDVDTINTTNFSNHPGYGTFQGEKSTPESVKRLFQGLRSILDFDRHYKLVMVGYCPSAEVMRAIYSELEPTVQRNTSHRPMLVVDPVLGDNGRLYVPEDVVSAHREFLTKGLVDLTTPNQFELEILTGVAITDLVSAKKALEQFYSSYKVPNTVLTSVQVEGKMYCVGYCHQATPQQRTFALEFEKINCNFSGCGDVFTALLTHEFYQNGGVLSLQVLGQVLHKLIKILRHSYEDEQKKIGTCPTMVKDVRLVSLRKVLDETEGLQWDVQYV